MSAVTGATRKMSDRHVSSNKCNASAVSALSPGEKIAARVKNRCCSNSKGATLSKSLLLSLTSVAVSQCLSGPFSHVWSKKSLANGPQARKHCKRAFNQQLFPKFRKPLIGATWSKPLVPTGRLPESKRQCKPMSCSHRASTLDAKFSAN